MSSYFNLYVKHKDSKPFLLKYFSRNHPIYEVIYENSQSVWIDKLDCKEWYAESHKTSGDRPCKIVSTEEQVVEPIPENKEYDDLVKKVFDKEITWDDLKASGIKAKFYGYFVEETYNSLPTFDEMLITKAAYYSKEELGRLADVALDDLRKAEKRAKEDANKYAFEQTIREVLHEAFPDKIIIKSEEEYDYGDWDEYLDDLRMAYYQILFLASLDEDIKVYGFFD